MNQIGKNRLSQRELNGYRQWLAELEEEIAAQFPDQPIRRD